MNELLIVSILLLMGGAVWNCINSHSHCASNFSYGKKTTAIEVFKPFFDKTHIWVLILSIIVTLLALAYSILTENWWWFGTSMLMHLNGPYTIVYMMPLNRRLMDPNVDPTSEQTANDIKKWGTLHLVRTLLNGVIFLAFIVLAVCTM